MIIELFGLSKTGKTIFKNKLNGLGYITFDPCEISNKKRIFYFLRYAIGNPKFTANLFYIMNGNHISKKFRVIKMRNTYLITTLAKYEYLKNEREKVFADEMALQSIFMILQKKSNKEEIEKIMQNLPKSDFIFLFERSREKRHKIYEISHPRFPNPTMYPGGWIDTDFAKKWMEIMEYNYEIIKQIILENYGEDNKKFKGIKLKLPKIYSKQ